MDKIEKVSMLDCTLRDGGCVNDFCFGERAMRSILSAVENSGIEYAELGYLDAWDGSPRGRSQYSDVEAICRNRLLENRNPRVTYLAMIDFGRYPAEILSPRRDGGLDGIRLCFHKKDAAKAIAMGQRILKKGYLLMLQPMVCSRYTDREFEELLFQIRERLETVSAVYVVDSFGVMNREDVEKRLRQADRILGEKICLGLHTHNNRNLSTPNAAAAFHMELEKPLILDGTLLGLGKGAGNLRTETFAEYLNRHADKHYDAKALRKASEEIIRPMRNKYRWGYCPEYLLSAKYCLTPSYARMFCDSSHLPMEEIDCLLARVPDEKKDSFDKKTAEYILDNYRRQTKRRSIV